MPKELTPEMLDELRTQITSYFEAYYSALRNEIAGHDALYDSIPRYFKGTREVVTNFCRDGVLIVHLPEENGRAYESEWTRMDIASWNNLGMWRDKRQARGLARNELRPYLEGL